MSDRMERFSRPFDAEGNTVGLAITRFVMMIMGLTHLAVGILMAADIVMVPGSIVVGMIGIATFIAGATMFDEEAP
jgi:hypothetical protein